MIICWWESKQVFWSFASSWSNNAGFDIIHARKLVSIILTVVDNYQSEDNVTGNKEIYWKLQMLFHHKELFWGSCSLFVIYQRTVKIKCDNNSDNFPFKYYCQNCAHNERFGFWYVSSIRYHQRDDYKLRAIVLHTGFFARRTVWFCGMTLTNLASLYHMSKTTFVVLVATTLKF